MADLIQFPFTRQSYANIDNPMYSQDVVAANQQVLAAITALSGLGASDFAIFSGLQYIQVTSGTNYYTPGIFFLNGVWYYQSVDFNEHLYLKANVIGIMPYTFTDSTERDLYVVNYAQSTASPTSATPQFTGSMDAYRLDLKTLLEQIGNLITATTLQVSNPASFTGTEVLNFRNDQSIFYTASSGDVLVQFDMTGAIPGTVVTIKFTFGGGQTITINAGAGNIFYLESGTLSSAASNVNIMYFIYAGIDELSLKEIRGNISQV